MDDPKVLERLKELEDAATQARLKKAASELREYDAKLFDRGAAYTNLVSAAGYAAAFTVWSSIRSGLSVRQNAAIALSITISLSIFVGFEVYKITGLQMWLAKLARSLSSKPVTLEQVEAMLRNRESASAEYAARQIIAWRITFPLVLISAAPALTLILWNSLALTFNIATWP